MPRLFRQSPLNAIWEGSGNVIALDVLRAVAREPEGVGALNAFLAGQRGRNAAYDAWIDAIDLRPAPAGTARLLVERAEERSVGNGCVLTCRSRGWPDN